MILVWDCIACCAVLPETIVVETLGGRTSSCLILMGTDLDERPRLEDVTSRSIFRLSSCLVPTAEPLIVFNRDLVNRVGMGCFVRDSCFIFMIKFWMKKRVAKKKIRLVSNPILNSHLVAEFNLIIWIGILHWCGFTKVNLHPESWDNDNKFAFEIYLGYIKRDFLLFIISCMYMT